MYVCKLKIRRASCWSFFFANGTRSVGEVVVVRQLMLNGDHSFYYYLPTLVPSTSQVVGLLDHVVDDVQSLHQPPSPLLQTRQQVDAEVNGLRQ